MIFHIFSMGKNRTLFGIRASSSVIARIVPVALMLICFAGAPAAEDKQNAAPAASATPAQESDETVARDPDYLAAKAAEKAGDFSAMFGAAKKLQAKYPGNNLALIALENAVWRSKQYKAAGDISDAPLPYPPDDPALAVSQARLIIRSLDKYPALQNNRIAEQVLRMAPFNNHAGETPEAGAWKILAVDYSDLGQPASAAGAYRRAVAADPGDASAWAGLGHALFTLDSKWEAVDALKTATRLDPGNGAAWFDLARLYRDLLQIDDAPAAWEHAAKLLPDYAPAWLGLGAAYCETGRLEEGLAAQEHSAKLDPKNGETWDNLALTYAGLGQTAKALDAFARAAKLEPGDAGLWYQYGLSYDKAGQTANATAAYRKALKLLPTFKDAKAALDHDLAQGGGRKGS